MLNLITALEVRGYAEFCIKDMNIMADCAYNRQCIPSMCHYVRTRVSTYTYAFIVILYSVAKGGRMRNVEIAPSLSPTCSTYHSMYHFIYFARKLVAYHKGTWSYLLCQIFMDY